MRSQERRERIKRLLQGGRPATTAWLARTLGILSDQKLVSDDLRRMESEGEVQLLRVRHLSSPTYTFAKRRSFTLLVAQIPRRAK